MTTDRLTAILAERVMGWRVAPGRIMMANRQWMRPWRFQPTKRLEDAFRLLDAANPDKYSISYSRGGAFAVQLQIGGVVGVATDGSKARAITYAVARAIGLEPEGRKLPKTGVDSQ